MGSTVTEADGVSAQDASSSAVLLHKRHANATCSCVQAFEIQKDVRELRFGVRMWLAKHHE